MLRITLIGYGKMGRMIEQLILQQGQHTVVEVIDISDSSKLKALSPAKTDVAIEFTMPNAVMDNIKICAENKVPLVVGTTGWYDKMEEVKTLVEKNNSALIWASNFSIGVNLFFRLNKYAATLLKQFPAYELKVKEIHHTEKKDAPSGTAISIAKDISTATMRNFEKIPIESERIENVVGFHSVKYTSPADEITLSHEAFNRKGFALGSIKAAEWIAGKKGLYNFSDIFDQLG
jgi:4-hydroxy-tetrahydrodipicolinate reductase